MKKNVTLFEIKDFSLEGFKFQMSTWHFLLLIAFILLLLKGDFDFGLLNAIVLRIAEL